MRELVLAAATGNPGKAREIQAVLGPLGVRVLTAVEAGAPEGFAPVEDGSTFDENSLIKAEALREVLLGRAPVRGAGVDGVIADDSGLCVDALGGAPGVYSARFAEIPPAAANGRPPAAGSTLCGGEKRDHGAGADARNVAKLLALLEGVPDEERTARFVCVVTLLPCGDGVTKTVCRGECEGRITREPRGVSGFGYDPVFVPLTEEAAGGARTFAEMSGEEKNAVSHRGRALAKLRESVQSLF
jgi:XTP/dITP diphosphohydrolase